MGDARDDGIPTWQRASPETTKSEAPTPTPAPDPATETSTTETSTTETNGDTMDDTFAIAKRFLNDEKVKDEPRPKKIAFLKSKGVKEEHIHKLLGQSHHMSTPEAAPDTDPETHKSDPPAPAPAPAPAATATATAAPDRAPIVTYPEFLTKPLRPPPLVTTHGLIQTFYAFAGLSTLVYGASRFALEPMVDSLGRARQELHDTVATELTTLVTQLERTVSVVPSNKPDQPSSMTKTKPSSATTTTTDHEDPAEMFHRDVATQTSPGDLLSSRFFLVQTPQQPPPPPTHHAATLTKLARGVTRICDAVDLHCADLEDITDLADDFRHSLGRISLPPAPDLMPAAYGPRSTTTTPASRGEQPPEDEVRKARDTIRRIKGLLLSTRSFPASTR